MELLYYRDNGRAYTEIVLLEAATSNPVRLAIVKFVGNMTQPDCVVLEGNSAMENLVVAYGNLNVLKAH
ncbi:hypothetical protein Tco_0407769 [Tanacetum coccineum]